MSNLISGNLVCFDVEASTKEEVIRILAEKMAEDGRLTDTEQYVQAVLDREQHYSTGVGFEVATPHAKTDAVKLPSLAFARLTNPIQWDEDETASLIFQIGVPAADGGNRHLEILAKLSRNLIHEEFREQLAQATTAQQVIELVGNV